MTDSQIQTSLFEDDYLVTVLGQLAQQPQLALTELVANAWDAGATRVAIMLPGEIGGTLTVADNGTGMTSEQFRNRWMKLGYNRLKHQGSTVEFPPNRPSRARKAYGRHGVGRHGLLCFADSYEVETCRDGVVSTFGVSTESGASPFVFINQSTGKCTQPGTRLIARVERKLPDPDEMLKVLAARFVHDPEFEITVNGITRPFTEITGKVSEETIDLGGGCAANIIVIDSTRVNHSSLHQGIAFWVQNRLVGHPSWTIPHATAFDGRTHFARRFKIIVATTGFEAEVEADWAGFKPVENVRVMFKKTAEHIEKMIGELASETVEESSADALSQNRNELELLGKGAQYEVAEFTQVLAKAHPTMSPDFLVTAVNAVINLQKSKSGALLLQKLAALPPNEIDLLDRLLMEWSIQDALLVLDEIHNRIAVVELISRLASDPDTDELHTLHPLVLRSRWLFGHEYESNQYCSNNTLRTVAKTLFDKHDAKFVNEKNRPDVVVLPDKTTCQLTGIEHFDNLDPTVLQLEKVLLIELKKGGFSISRKEMTQAVGYVQDIAGCTGLSSNAVVNAWVVGATVQASVAKENKIGNNDLAPFSRTPS